MKRPKLFQKATLDVRLLGLWCGILGVALLPSSLHATSKKFAASGTFTPPAGITNVTVECWGGGGAGGSSKKTTIATGGGGGGGGGAYAMKLNVPVTPGTPYTVTIPNAAAAPSSGFVAGDRVNGANVTFTGDGGISVTANGGQGGGCGVDNTGTLGTGGAAGVGFDAAFAGGNGATYTSNAGAGGSGASDLGAGNAAVNATPGAAKAGSDADHNGGIGGTGKSGAGNGNNTQMPPGGGGGGAKTSVNSTTYTGSSGAKGQIIISYSGATVTKDNNTDNLYLGTSWVGGNPPDSSGTAKWDSIVQATNTTVLGMDLAWGSIIIADPVGPVTIDAGNTLTLNGEIDMSVATEDLTLNCGLALGGPAVWNVATNRTLTLGGVVSGSFNITKQGDGKVIMSAANIYSGMTAINGGTLQLGASGVIPDGSGKGDVSVAAGGTLDLNSFNDTINGLSGAGMVDNTAAGTTSTLTVGGNSVSSIFSGVIKNSGLSSTNNLVKTGNGQLTLSGPNTFTGTVTVNDGALNLGIANPLPTIRGLTIGGATLGYQANNAVISAPIKLSGNVTVIQNSVGAVLASLNAPITGSGNMTFATGDATMNNDNKVSLGAASSFTGNVTITTSSVTAMNNMTLRLGAVNALPATAVVTLDGQNGNGTSWCDLNLNGFDQTLAGLTFVKRTTRLQRVYNPGTSAAATLTISNSVDTTFGFTLGKASGNNFGLTKDGSGKLTLAAMNTYTGATTVVAGTLVLATSNTVSFLKPLALAGGTLAFGTNHTLGIKYNLVMAGGTLDMGIYTNALGTLMVNNNPTIALGAGELSFTNSSAVVWTGTLDLTGELGATTLRFGENFEGLSLEQMHLMKWQGKSVVLDNLGYVILKRGTVILLK